MKSDWNLATDFCPTHRNISSSDPARSSNRSMISSLRVISIGLVTSAENGFTENLNSGKLKGAKALFAFSINFRIHPLSITSSSSILGMPLLTIPVFPCL
ncbi:unnamed protein product [Toxocara canis]|uniref:Uncharacterized protein n=1 Tax=Toxocara canis TaxID=6265 RepID=A0A183TY72_TOXCA|nr:unnamed protein product [Toxocara canis]